MKAFSSVQEVCFKVTLVVLKGAFSSLIDYEFKTSLYFSVYLLWASFGVLELPADNLDRKTLLRARSDGKNDRSAWRRRCFRGTLQWDL